jgi:aspartyl-tRNA(Asn)/glutamyl-tRNA(Gln) amidotransferase subunit B
MTTTTELQPAIGLEVHAQVLTASKMFCGCDARYFDARPNTHVCAVCGGMPGSLPVINRRAVEHTVMTALALGCRIAPESKFDRKNYSYPDIPKGYQISQYDTPIGLSGRLLYRVDGDVRECRITRVHLEEDTGKSIHTSMGGRGVSLIDYNRSGVPLMEIVTEPDLRSPLEAREFFAALRQVLMYLGVCDGRLQEGSMRADVNVSLREGTDGALGTKVEIKNLNSFRAVQHALEYEVERQREVILSGGRVAQETRGWSERDEITVSQRTKEYAHDYRYFPEPDLPPLTFSSADLEAVGACLPELPQERFVRFEREYEMSAYTAGILTEERELADFFEDTVQASGVDVATVTNWVTGELLRLLHDSGISSQHIPITPASLARLLVMIRDESVSASAAKRVLEEMFRTGDGPEVIVEREDLGQIVDRAALEALVDRVLVENGKLVERFKSGKTNVLQALVGKAMQASAGKASPTRVREILEEKLAID